jgi:hypothetical protein
MWACVKLVKVWEEGLPEFASVRVPYSALCYSEEELAVLGELAEVWCSTV